MARVEVNVVEARNLIQENKLRKNYSFVRIYYRNQRGKTRTIENTNDPQWNETFLLNNVKREDILYFDIYNQDGPKHKVIGSIEIKLKKLFKKGRIDAWYHIPAKVGLACYGQIRVILEFSRDEG